MPPPAHVGTPTVFGGSSALPRPKRTHMIHLQLSTVEVPIGVASGSEELWSYLDEEPVSLRSKVLGLNGVRVGLGRAETWSDLEAVLKRMTGQSYKQTTLQTFAARPAAIELKTDQPIQTIFTSFEDRTLSGQQYPPGDNLLTLSCTLDEDDPNMVLVTGIPQIRSAKRIPRVIHEHGTPRILSKPEIFTFTPLIFQLVVHRNDFLVIGPGIQARRPTTPGHHFLTRIRDGVPYETVLLLRPLVHSVELVPVK
jgi:hypothetical protein